MKTCVIKKLLASLLVIFILGAIPEQPAFAATNGQQIEIRSAVIGTNGIKTQGVKWMSGTNQNNQTMNYMKYLIPAVSSHKISKYYWKGDVKVELYVIDSKGKTNIVKCTIAVPTWQWTSDWVTVGFNFNRCWKML